MIEPLISLGKKTVVAMVHLPALQDLQITIL